MIVGPLDYHLLAHRDGRYRTCEQTPGVTTAERAALEQLFFGQSNSADYLKSLQQEPGVIWRYVGQRVALTRVRRGKPDSHGRPTLEYESIVFPPTLAQRVAGSLSRIVLARWDRTERDCTIQLPDPSPIERPDPRLLELIQSRPSTIVNAAAHTLSDVASVAAAFSLDSSFSLCFKALSDAAPVRLNFVAREKSATEPRTHSPSAPLPPPPAPMRTEPMRSPMQIAMTIISLCLNLATLVAVGVVWSGQSARTSESGLAQTNIIGSIEGNTQNTVKVGVEELKNVVIEELKKKVEPINEKLAATFAAIDTLKAGLDDAKQGLSKLDNNLDAVSKEIASKSDLEATKTAIEASVEKSAADAQKGLVTETERAIIEARTKLDELSKQIDALDRSVTKVQAVLGNPEKDAKERSIFGLLTELARKAGLRI